MLSLVASFPVRHYYGSFFSAADEKKYKDLIWAGASASAELIADIGLCPFEAVKVVGATGRQAADEHLASSLVADDLFLLSLRLLFVSSASKPRRSSPRVWLMVSRR